MNGLEVEGLVVTRGSAPVLSEVALRVPHAGRLALVGPSGAGKTTLLRAVAGLDEVQAGVIRVGGRDITGMPPHRRPIAMVFQEPRLLPHATVLENVALPLRVRGVGRRTRRARAQALLDEVGLAGSGGRSPRTLSGGEQQRVSLARALSAEPALLLLDEPLASLDPGRAESLRSLILRIQRDRGITTLVVTHDRVEASFLGERVALMIEGRIRACDTPEALFHRPGSLVVARFFGARNLISGDVRSGRMETVAGDLPVVGADGPAVIAIRPERIGVVDAPDGPLRVMSLEAAGPGVRVRLAGPGMVLEAEIPSPQAPPIGAAVCIEVAPDAIWRLPESGAPQPAENVHPA